MGSSSSSAVPEPVMEPPPPEPTKKDASSVLGILQMAQNNAARGRVSKTPAAAAGTAPSASSAGSSSANHIRILRTDEGPRKAQGNPWQALLSRLPTAGTSSDSRRSIEKEVLGMLPQLEPTRV